MHVTRISFHIQIVQVWQKLIMLWQKHMVHNDETISRRTPPVLAQRVKPLLGLF